MYSTDGGLDLISLKQIWWSNANV